MSLLALPPEILQLVVAEFVTTFRVAKAWKKRRVCRDFQVAIDYEIFAKQPLKAFTGKKARRTKRVLTNRAALYLSYRVEVLNGADEFLLGPLNRVLSAVGLDRVNGDANLRKHVSAKLCRLLMSFRDQWYVYSMLIGQDSVDAEKAKFKRYYFSRKSESATRAAVAAIILGDLQVLRDVIDNDIAALWSDSSFGQPLTTVVLEGHTQLVTAMVQHFGKMQRKMSDHIYSSQFKPAIEAAFERGDSNVATQLFTAVNEHFYHLPKFNIEQWTCLALISGDKAAFKAAITIRSRESVSSHVDAYTLACQQGDPEFVRPFFDNGYLNINDSLNGLGDQCPLSIAVKSCQAEVVRVVLLLGAHSDAPWTDNPMKRPLWIALNYNYVPVVHSLLEAGANPELVMSIDGTRFFDYYCGRESFKKCFLEAVERHDYYIDRIDYETKLTLGDWV